MTAVPAPRGHQPVSRGKQSKAQNAFDTEEASFPSIPRSRSYP